MQNAGPAGESKRNGPFCSEHTKNGWVAGNSHPEGKAAETAGSSRSGMTSVKRVASGMIIRWSDQRSLLSIFVPIKRQRAHIEYAVQLGVRSGSHLERPRPLTRGDGRGCASLEVSRGQPVGRLATPTASRGATDRALSSSIGALFFF
jgi:hypothetical protein